MISSRNEGCTLTGALSVTTSVQDAVSVIHGPEGCAHHNFSLLHALHFDNDQLILPAILSTSLREQEIIFGGEEALEETIAKLLEDRPGAVFVLTSCVAAAIGDDVRSVCNEFSKYPVVFIPTGGFLGGGFSDGVRSALVALSGLGQEGYRSGMVTLVGEKNLEYEAEANYREIARLLSLLGVKIQLRFVRNIPVSAIKSVGSSSLNILRDESLTSIGSALKDRFGTPFLPSFPTGFEGTLRFLSKVAESLDIESEAAIAAEMAYQREIINRFSVLKGKSVRVRYEGFQVSCAVLTELLETFDLDLKDHGPLLALPDPVPVGTSGLSRLLSRWQRVLHA
jgi:nitrogenase molybdenum-iron protein alpha/beta subunit